MRNAARALSRGTPRRPKCVGTGQREYASSVCVATATAALREPAGRRAAAAGSSWRYNAGGVGGNLIGSDPSQVPRWAEAPSGRIGRVR